MTLFITRTSHVRDSEESTVLLRQTIKAPKERKNINKSEKHFFDYPATTRVEKSSPKPCDLKL